MANPELHAEFRVTIATDLRVNPPCDRVGADKKRPNRHCQGGDVEALGLLADSPVDGKARRHGIDRVSQGPTSQFVFGALPKTAIYIATRPRHVNLAQRRVLAALAHYRPRKPS